MGEVQRQILLEASGFLARHLPMAAGLAAAALVAIAAESLLGRGIGERGRRRIGWGLVAAGVAIGLALAWQVLWLADDAYISFRYARNLARGLGLVFNEGEWVEGYTNFLWTALLGGLGWLGVDIPYAGLFGCLLCFVLALVVVAITVRKVTIGPAVIPFAVLVLAGLSPFFTFASSGLETMPLALFGALAMWASTLRRGALLAGLVLVLGAMTRPDFLLVYGCMGLALAAEDLIFLGGPVLRRINVRRLAGFVAPFALLYVPYFLLRWHAYGDLFPNTYYAKSGGLSYFRQGWVYLFHFVVTTGAWLWIPLFVLSQVGRPRERNETRLRIFALLSVVIYGAYVVKVGGDFMEHRFLVPLLPIVGIATEISLRNRLRGMQTIGSELLTVGFASIAIAVALVPIRLIGPYEKRWFLAAEHTFYPVTHLFPLRVGSGYMEEGEAFHRILLERGLRPRLVGAAIGMVSYYSDLPMVDSMGLTNRRIAHKPVQGRGRPGHEKFATNEELMADGAVISPWPMWGESWIEATRAEIAGHAFYFLWMEPELAAAISKIPGAKVPKPAEQIGRLVRGGSRDEVLAAVPFYRAFLGGRSDRDALLAPFAMRLQEVADFEDTMLPRGAMSFGRALEFARGVPPAGGSGQGWLTSMPGKGDGTGRLELPISGIGARELRFALGGTASDRISVRLVVDGEVVREARPIGGSRLHPVAWSMDGLRGKSGTLVIADEDPSAGAGLIVDGIHFSAAHGDVRDRIARWRTRGEGDPARLVREAELLLPEHDPDVREVASSFAERWTLDELPPGTSLIGTAFGRGPVSRAVGGQTPIAGLQGLGLLDSYHPDDGAVGRVEFPERELSGAPISVLVGGGMDCTKTYVGLEVGGQVVQRVCGRDDEVLRPAVLATKKWKGKRGRIVVVDDATGGWGHILLDDVIFLRP